MTTLSDPRISPVEDNPLALFDAVSVHPTFTRLEADDVCAFWSDVAFPLFNFVGGARFAPGEEVRRTAELLHDFLGRGLPFMWLVTPTTNHPDLAAMLAEAGLVESIEPGMYRDLAQLPHVEGPVGLTLEPVTPESLSLAVETMTRGFGFPDFAGETMEQVLRDVDLPGSGHVLARLDGEPVGVGSWLITGGTVGLFNIATLAAARGRGVGAAVTVALMEAGREQGADHAILHASTMGTPVYRRLGFETVCHVSAWSPPE